MIIKFYLRGNLVLSTELMIKIGCHEKFVVATFRALAFFFFLCRNANARDVSNRNSLRWLILTDDKTMIILIE